MFTQFQLCKTDRADLLFCHRNFSADPFLIRNASSDPKIRLLILYQYRTQPIQILRTKFFAPSAKNLFLRISSDPKCEPVQIVLPDFSADFRSVFLSAKEQKRLRIPRDHLHIILTSSVDTRKLRILPGYAQFSCQIDDRGNAGNHDDFIFCEHCF